MVTLRRLQTLPGRKPVSIFSGRVSPSMPTTRFTRTICLPKTFWSSAQAQTGTRHPSKTSAVRIPYSVIFTPSP